MTALPPGVHPQDRRSAIGGPGWDSNPVPLETTPSPEAPAGRQPFRVPNGNAMQVFERAAKDWTATTIKVTTTSGTGGTAKLVGRTIGRQGVWLWVPATATHGVTLGPTQATVLNSGGVRLAASDGPLFIRTEGSIYAGLLPTATTGTICVLDLINPNGGK